MSLELAPRLAKTVSHLVCFRITVHNLIVSLVQHMKNGLNDIFEFAISCIFLDEHVNNNPRVEFQDNKQFVVEAIKSHLEITLVIADKATTYATFSRLFSMITPISNLLRNCDATNVTSSAASANVSTLVIAVTVRAEDGRMMLRRGSSAHVSKFFTTEITRFQLTGIDEPCSPSNSSVRIQNGVL
ncbi:hypothetical protein HAX54_014897 [Datura stramonium]|uniref:Uncharacterized protein n=1 Tax=Datura stramonium TaxID=4076 RepID=A0ABS8RZ80_DATST|nr:hypothetical protein [Datura stramonium]